MNRMDFFQALNAEMKGLPEAEKNRLLDYYAEYFHDMQESGMTEEEVAASLEPPHDIVERVRRELEQDTADEPPLHQSTAQQNKTHQHTTYVNNVNAGPSIKSSTLMIIILILTSPIWGGILIGVLGAIFGLLVGLAGVILAFCISGVTLLVVGLINLFIRPIEGVFMIGAGLVLTGLLFYCIALTVKCKQTLIVWAKLPGKWLRQFWQSFKQGVS